jgi:hypothetical protein
VVGRIRAISREGVAGVSERANICIGIVGEAVATVIVSGTAAGNYDTSLSEGAPRLSSGADALASLTVMVGGVRAIDWEGVASVGNRAQSSSGLKAQTISAGVPSSAA